MVLLNIGILFQFSKFLLEYHPYLLELTPYNLAYVLFMTSPPILATSALLYLAGKNTEFRTIFLRIVIAVALVFAFGFIMAHFFYMKENITLLPFVIAQ